MNSGELAFVLWMVPSIILFSISFSFQLCRYQGWVAFLFSLFQLFASLFSKVLGIIPDADSFGIYMSLGVMVQFL